MQPYLAQTCCEHDYLIKLTHLFQEIVNARPLDDIHVVPMILDFNRDDVVGMLYRLRSRPKWLVQDPSQ